jgi:hypothetical protein
MRVSSTSPEQMANAIVANLGANVFYPEIPCRGVQLAASLILQRAGISIA